MSSRRQSQKTRALSRSSDWRTTSAIEPAVQGRTYIVLSPSGGIPARSGNKPGKASSRVYLVDLSTDELIREETNTGGIGPVDVFNLGTEIPADQYVVGNQVGGSIFVTGVEGSDPVDPPTLEEFCETLCGCDQLAHPDGGCPEGEFVNCCHDCGIPFWAITDFYGTVEKDGVRNTYTQTGESTGSDPCTWSVPVVRDTGHEGVVAVSLGFGTEYGWSAQTTLGGTWSATGGGCAGPAGPLPLVPNPQYGDVGEATFSVRAGECGGSGDCCGDTCVISGITGFTGTWRHADQSETTVTQTGLAEPDPDQGNNCSWKFPTDAPTPDNLWRFELKPGWNGQGLWTGRGSNGFGEANMKSSTIPAYNCNGLLTLEEQFPSGSTLLGSSMTVNGARCADSRSLADYGNDPPFIADHRHWLVSCSCLGDIRRVVKRWTRGNVTDRAMLSVAKTLVNKNPGLTVPHVLTKLHRYYD